MAEKPVNPVEDIVQITHAAPPAHVEPSSLENPINLLAGVGKEGRKFMSYGIVGALMFMLIVMVLLLGGVIWRLFDKIGDLERQLAASSTAADTRQQKAFEHGEAAVAKLETAIKARDAWLDTAKAGRDKQMEEIVKLITKVDLWMSILVRNVVEAKKMIPPPKSLPLPPP